MKMSIIDNGPVVIGGLGGSGTRVVAEIIAHIGFYIGQDLNNASDNLTYTLLFKRPAWFRRNINNSRKLHIGLSILEKSMIREERLSFREKLFLRKAVHNMSKYGHNKAGEGKGEWPIERLHFIQAPQFPEGSKYHGWGWKEPNSHLLLPVLHSYFSHFRYIHTVRHGLDMAYSSNQQQLFNWAPLFGIDIPDSQSDIPTASFRYWVEANRKAISTGNQLGAGKFLLVNFDELCHEPLTGVKKIADFLRISLPVKVLAEASSLPVIPESAGRYKENMEDRFDPGDLSFLQDLGFSYER